jgi:hypothetical protein
MPSGGGDRFAVFPPISLLGGIGQYGPHRVAGTQRVPLFLKALDVHDRKVMAQALSSGN